MVLWFFNKVAWFVLAAMLEGILLPSNMVAKTTFCLYLVKRLIVTFRCAINVTTSSFQHFPWSLNAKSVFRKWWFIILKSSFGHVPSYGLSHFKNAAGLKNQITIILFKRWPTNSVSKAKSFNFHFHKNDVTRPLSASGLLNNVTHPLSNFVHFMIKKVTIFVKVLISQCSFSNHLVGNFTFVVHHQFEHFIVGFSRKHNLSSVELKHCSCHGP